MNAWPLQLMLCQRLVAKATFRDWPGTSLGLNVGCWPTQVHCLTSAWKDSWMFIKMSWEVFHFTKVISVLVDGHALTEQLSPGA